MYWRSASPDIHIIALLRMAKEDGKGKFASKPAHHYAVWHFSFLGYHVCKTFVEGLFFSSHASGGWHYQRGEDAVFDFLTLWPYALFFSSSCLLYAVESLPDLLLGAFGWKTLTPKKVSCLAVQKPLARISNLALLKWLNPYTCYTQYSAAVCEYLVAFHIRKCGFSGNYET